MVEIWGTSNWQCVAEFFSDRSDIQCQHRWEKFLSPELVKGSWTKEASDLNIVFIAFYTLLTSLLCMLLLMLFQVCYFFLLGKKISQISCVNVALQPYQLHIRHQLLVEPIVSVMGSCC